MPRALGAGPVRRARPRMAAAPQMGAVRPQKPPGCRGCGVLAPRLPAGRCPRATSAPSSSSSISGGAPTPKPTLLGMSPLRNAPSFLPGCSVRKGRASPGDLNVNLRTNARSLRPEPGAAAARGLGKLPAAGRAPWDARAARCSGDAGDYPYLFNLSFNQLLVCGRD